MTLATWQSRTQQLGAMADHEVASRLRAVKRRWRTLRPRSWTTGTSCPPSSLRCPMVPPQRNPVGPGESAAGEDPPRTGRASLSALDPQRVRRQHAAAATRSDQGVRLAQKVRAAESSRRSNLRRRVEINVGSPLETHCGGDGACACKGQERGGRVRNSSRTDGFQILVGSTFENQCVTRTWYETQSPGK